MIREYHYGDTEQLAEHFRALEFQCKCAGRHNFKLDDELVEKMELFFRYIPQLFGIQVKEIRVSSGYRCPAHDKSPAVGGSGTGQHTLGRAADICVIGEDGKPVVSYLVCIAAQEIGFRGIARINDAYTHCDTRNGRWYGDETEGNSFCIPCADFYEYFNVERKGETGMATNGIDVSKHNGKIDWKEVKEDGIEYAILRAGLGKYAKQKDERFEENYAGAKAAGLPVGAYWYSYAVTVEEAKEEARACIEVLKGKQFEFPIWFDQEEKTSLDTGKANCSAMIRAFCTELEKAGYFVGLYTSRSFLTTHVEDDIKTRYALWIAECGDKLNYSGAVGMWQNSATGRVDGITGDVDLDGCFVDYPTRIKAKGLNGYGKPIEKPPESAADDGIPVRLEIGDATYIGKLNKV